MQPTTRFLDVLKGRPADTTPIWIMRQAGRYLPEYRGLREKYTFLDMCKTPELAARVTLQPLERFALDAAILFSDILIPLEPMGLELTFHESEGPRLVPAVRDEASVHRLDPAPVAEATAYVPAAVRLIKNELADRVPLIGFAGAPFTLACYAVEGGGSHDFHRVKQMMYAQPELFHLLLEKLTQAVQSYLAAQVEAGVDAVQIFDTWGGLLAPEDFQEFELGYVCRLVSAVQEAGVPVIYFVLDGAHLLTLSLATGSTALGVDWRIPMPAARAAAGPQRVLQGNLDPAALYGPEVLLRSKVRTIIDGAGAGHIFNLGHGIRPDVPVEAVGQLVELVHELGWK